MAPKRKMHLQPLLPRKIHFRRTRKFPEGREATRAWSRPGAFGLPRGTEAVPLLPKAPWAVWKAPPPPPPPTAVEPPMHGAPTPSTGARPRPNPPPPRADSPTPPPPPPPQGETRRAYRVPSGTGINSPRTRPNSTSRRPSTRICIPPSSTLPRLIARNEPRRSASPRRLKGLPPRTFTWRRRGVRRAWWITARRRGIRAF
mmetsp:Transcript_9447/g.16788  ORF Transcript_9447/g.16788 Transcript_9447/m.16788 type:complete len:201 (+) Transcript_9447:850-1452(+)